MVDRVASGGGMAESYARLSRRPSADKLIRPEQKNEAAEIYRTGALVSCASSVGAALAPVAPVTACGEDG